MDEYFNDHQHQHKKQQQKQRTEDNITPELVDNNTCDINNPDNDNNMFNFNFNQQQHDEENGGRDGGDGGGGGGGATAAAPSNNQNTNNNNNTNTNSNANNKIDSSLAEFLKDMSINDQNEGLAFVYQQQQQRNNNEAIIDTIPTEFNNLSQLQRECALHDIHGVNNDERDSLIRTDDEIQLSLKQMDDWLLQQQQQPHANNNNNVTDEDDNDIIEEDIDIIDNAYNLAYKQNPFYVQDVKLRLMFLRSTRYNPELSAKKFINYLKLKLQLFGLNLLTKPICSQQNLNQDDIKFMKLGAMQLLPTRDNAGRAIIVIFPSLFNQCPSHDNVIRSFFYTFMIALKDVSTQITGITVVIDACADESNINKMSKPNPTLFMECTKLIKALPIKIQGRHFCTNNNMYGFLGTYISRFHSQSVRIRSRFHVGSHIECMYSLMTFGIPVDRFPTSRDCLGLKVGRHVKFLNVLRILEDKFPFFCTESGINNNNTNNTIKKNNGVDDDNDNDDIIDDLLLQPVPIIHNQQQQRQQQRIHHSHSNEEEENNRMTLVVVPSQNDVLFGRGKPIQLHPGNVWLGSIVEDMVPVYYQETTREGKTSVAQHVVQLIKGRGGRFLRPYNHAIDGKGGGGKNRGGGAGGSSSSSSNSSNSSGGCIWIEVDDEKGQEKVCTAFRSFRATQKHKNTKNQQQQQQQFHTTDPTTTTMNYNYNNFGQKVLRQQQHQQQMNASKRARTYT